MKRLPDILEVLGAAGLEPAGREGRELLFACPFHPDRRPSMRVNRSKQVYFCPPCAASGDARGSGGVAALATALGVRLLDLGAAPVPRKPSLNAMRPPSYGGKAPRALWDGLEARDATGEAYLARRFLHGAAERGLVRFASEGSPGLAGTLAGRGFRVAALLVDAAAQPQGVSFRNLGNGSHRFRVVGSVKGTFYGTANVTTAIDALVIAEGMADWLTISIHSASSSLVLGLQSAAAFEATSVRALVEGSAPRVYVLGHGDDAGRAVAHRVQLALNQSGALVAFPPSGMKDWNELLARVQGNQRAFMQALAVAVELAKGRSR